ncbi:MAG: hypothetical protein CVT84_08270 [Alphaproteobacteria bacterium HGW-Alphaproteobacteria-6]|nr:MAG: hypothetical protein CVT84_08270 [Alphaproteobacteria bacterium HGW-Alphaproteobacteria-6]
MRKPALFSRPSGRLSGLLGAVFRGAATGIVVSASLAATLGVAPAARAAAQGTALDIRPHEAPAVCGAHQPQIAVTVAGVRPGGILTVELYRPSAGDFLRKASRLKRVRVPAGQAPQTVCFDVAAAGRYAVAAYHDVNANRDLDRKWNQLPDEPFALSGGKTLGLGMPTFEDAAFEAGAGGAAIRIELRR